MANLKSSSSTIIATHLDEFLLIEIVLCGRKKPATNTKNNLLNLIFMKNGDTLP
jgi:hypothetical protein